MKRARRLLITSTLAALLVVAGSSAADVLAFDMRAQRFEQALAQYAAEGVPRPPLDALRAEAGALRARTYGPLPYPAVSGAAVQDPFAGLEIRARTAWESSVLASRSDAESALEGLRQEAGARSRLYDDEALVARARTPAEYQQAAADVRTEAAAVALAKKQLSDAAGGLSADGLPNDVVTAAAQLRSLTATLEQGGLESDPGRPALVDAQIYLNQPYSGLAGGHDAIVAELGAALHTLQTRVDMKSRGEALFAQLPGLFGQLVGYGGLDAATQAAADSYHVELENARTDDQLAKADSDLRAFVDQVSGSIGSGRLPLAGIGCVAGAPAQLIEIHLATQQLIAYDGGCPILRTPVTTGRPALPTDRGTWHIFYKTTAYKMVSPWPKDSPFWYPDTWVYWAMEFVGDGTFIHNADWQPDDTYGPGSEYGPFASHGCVHVMDAPLQALYAWAQVGATVVVED